MKTAKPVLPLEVPRFKDEKCDDLPIAVDDSMVLDKPIQGSEDSDIWEPTMAKPDVVDVPPERVRFTAPATLKPEEFDETCDAAVINLSTTGAAALASIRSRPGQRLWLQFRLGLADKDPINLLCKTIWCAKTEDGHWALGLHFASLTNEERQKIADIVAERSTGKAGDWPLPIIPDNVGSSQVRRTSPWFSAAAGLAAGIGLTLALSVIPKTYVQSNLALDFATASATQQQDARSDTQVVTKHDVNARSQKKAILVEPVTPKATALVKSSSISSASGNTETTSSKKSLSNVASSALQNKSISAGLLPRIDTQTKQKTSQGVLKPLGTEQHLELALLVDGPVGRHQTFWLHNPKRLVVDVLGRKNGFIRKSYDIEHPLAKRLRVGQHKEYVRFVIETTNESSQEVRTRIQGKALLVSIQKDTPSEKIALRK